jgi:iron complex outermembrane recepter protein
MKHPVRHRRLAAASYLTATICVAGTSAHAQTTPRRVEEGLIQEIIVTAQKRAENAQDVPISISTLSGENLAQQRIANVTGLAAQVPNLQITTPYNDAIPVFSLRGVSAVDYSQNQSSPVALYVDEVYKGLSVFTSLQMFDLERVEVLRGPQGTLYGKNTTGGAINFYSKAPDLAEGFAGHLAAGIGSYNRHEVDGGVNVPMIGHVLGARIAFALRKADGFIDNLAGEDQSSIDDRAVRASVAFQPFDGLKAVLRYTSSRSTPTGYGIIADDIGIKGPGEAGFGTGYTRDGLDFLDNEVDRVGRLDIENEGAMLAVTWDAFAAASFTSVSSYDEGRWLTEEDFDGTPFNLLHDDFLSRAKAWSQDLRLASTGDGSLQWLLGAYFYRDRVLSSQTYRFYYAFAGDNDGSGELDCPEDGVTGCRYDNEFSQTRRSRALYTQATYELTDELGLTAGLRYTRDDNRLDYYRAALGFLEPATNTEVVNVFPTITAPPVDRARDSNVSGKIGLDYRATERVLLYLTMSRGYRGSSFNGQALTSPEEVTIAEPERLDAYELGLKTQSADNRLRLNGAAFYYDYQNQQFLDVTPQGLQVLYNAPQSRIYGAELELTARASVGLQMRVGISYMDAQYREITLQGADLSGNRLIVAPQWTAMGGIDWQSFKAAFGSLTLHTDSRYTSRQFYDAFNTPEVAQPSYVLHDARLTFSSPGEAVSVSAWIKNITDKEYRVYRLDLSDNFNFNGAQRGRPREYGIEAIYRF